MVFNSFFIAFDAYFCVEGLTIMEHVFYGLC